MTRTIFLPILLLAAVANAQDYGDTKRMKIMIGGRNRKLVIFCPKGVRKGEVLPLLVAVPGTKGESYNEAGSWQQQAHEKRFAVMSVDIKSAALEGWSPRDQTIMARDMEAVEEGIKRTIAFVEQQGGVVDRSATIITAYSGGTYLTLWMGLRRPDLFLGICGRSTMFHKETVEFGKLDRKPNLDQHIFLFSGELDMSRSPSETQTAVKLLRKKGYRNVTFRLVPKLDHGSGPGVFLEWFYALLKETARGRAEAQRIANALVKVKEAIEKKRAGAHGKLQKLVDREKKAGFSAGAVKYMAEIMKAANKKYGAAADLEANHDYDTALKELKTIERTYSGLPIAKKARAFAIQIKKSNGYLAAQMLVKAKALKAKGKDVKAATLLEKITKQYPDTAAAEEAEHLLSG